MRLPTHLGRYVTIALALMAAGFFAAYLRFLPYLAQETSYTDGRTVYELSDLDRLRYAVWDAPVPLPPEINADAAPGRATLSPDGTLLVFAVGEPGLNADLWVADMLDGEPVDPRPLERVNSIGDDLSPAFSGDGLLYASNRSGSRGFDIWRAPYADGVFGAPERVQGALNTDHDELDPTPVPGSRAITYASNQPRGMRRDLDLYTAVPRGAGGEWDITAFETANTPFDEREPTYTGDALGMVFSSDRDGGPGGFDLFHSVQSAGAWQEPERLKGLNTPADERGPFLAGDGFTLYFTESGVPGAAGLVRARSLELFRVPGRRVGWFDLTLLALLLLVALLGWLGRKWEALDVIYKCLLVSLIVHALLLWWFRDVFMEQAEGALPDRERSFQVELAPSSSALARSQERAGDVQVAAARGDAPDAPDRQEQATPRATSAAQPASAALGPARLVEARDTAALDARREPVAVASSARAQSADRSAVDVALPDAQVERREGGAPSLAVDAQPTGATPATATGQAPAERSSSGMLAPASASIGVSAPVAGPLAQPAADAGAPELAARPDAAAPAPLPRVAAAGVAVQQPRAAIEQLTGGAPQLGLSALPTEAAPTAPGEARRADRVTTALPSAVAAIDAGTPGSSALPAPAPVAAATSTVEVRQVSVAQRPERASADRPLTVAEPSALVASAALAEGPSAEGARGLDLSSLGAAARADGPERALQSPGRRATDEPAPAMSALQPPPTTSLQATVAEGGAPPPPERGTEDAAAERPTRGLPQVALDDRSAEAVLPQQPAAVHDAGPAMLDASGDGLMAAVSAESARIGALAPQRFLTAAGAPGVPDAGTGPEFRPLAAALATMVAPERSKPERNDWEHTQYRTRFGDAKKVALKEHGGSEKTEAAVVSGLAYLARMQSGAGYWGDPEDVDDKYGQMLVGKTGLCLLAFLGAGHTPVSGTEYSAVTDRAVSALLAFQDPGTGHFGNTSSYSHAIATYALAECYALTTQSRLRAPIQRGVDWILQHQARQNDPRFKGGWGYYYPDGRTFDPWPRTSVTVWQVMALESARVGGLRVPDRAFDDARTFLLNAYDQSKGVVLYNHAPARLESAYATLPGSTPAGLFGLSLLGEDITDDEYDRAVVWVLDKAPDGYREGDSDAFVHRAQGNLYFWYYGSLALFRLGGDPWERWNRKLQDTLLPAQAPDGSWEPISVYAKFAGDTDADRSYSTAMCVLTLEVYYRYFTPLLHVR